MPRENSTPHPEADRIIPSSDTESKPSRETRQKQEQAEKDKEKLKLKEKLEKAVKELQKMREGLDKNSQEYKRIQHTLASVNYAVKNLGKEGAPAGKYKVNVEGYDGQLAYVQNEGVPVDEIIKLLRQKVEKLKQQHSPQNLKKIKDKRDQLWAAYRAANESVERDNTYSQYQEANKEYEKMREEVESGNPTAGQVSALADDLYNKSKTYFEQHYDKKEYGEDPNAWTQQDRQKQDLRTRHEGHLISRSGDYRASKNPNDDERQGEDYRTGMAVMKERRELDLEEKEEAPVAVPEPVPAPPEPVEEPERLANINEPYDPENNIDQVPEPKEPEPVPVTPEPIPGPVQPEPWKAPSPEYKMPERVAVVSADAQVELMATKRGNERLTEMLNHQSKIKKWWYRSFEQGYRQQLINEERKKILGEENKPGLIRRKLFGAETFAATGKKNLFAGTAKEGENKAELAALADRFAKGYIRDSKAGGEQKEQLEDPEFNKRLTDLVTEYGSGNMSDADFEAKSDLLIADIAKKYPESFAAGKLTANNFLETAQEFRKIYIHSQGAARLDKGLSIDLGLAKQAIKTKANINFVDKFISKLQKYPVIGHLATPEGVGFAISLGSYFAKKPAYYLGGAVGAGALLGGMRRNTEQKRDLEMHRMERAMGNEISDYGQGAKRRAEMEKFVDNMRTSEEIVAEVQSLRAAFEASPNRQTADQLTKAVAQAEARMQLSEERGRDLISFGGETVLERSRMGLIKELADAQVLLQQAGLGGEISQTKSHQDSLKALSADMDKLDKSERWHRWKENAKAAAIGAVTGLVVSSLTQEMLALGGDWIRANIGNMNLAHWMRPGGKATSLESFADYTGLNKLPGAGWLAHGMYQPSGGRALTEMIGSHGAVKINSTTELVPNGSGGGFVLRDAADHTSILAKMDIDPTTGRVTPVPGSYDPRVIDFHSGGTMGGGPRPISEWMDPSKSHFGSGVKEETWHTTGFLDNNTPKPKFEFNELRFYMQFDSSGNLTLDSSKIKEYLENTVGEQIQGSRHGDRVLQVMEAFKRGELQIGIAPDPDHPSKVLALTLDPSTNKFVVQGGGASDLMNVFGTDAKGHPVYKGKGFMGLGHILGQRADGSKNVEWVNSIRGNGDEIGTGSDERLITEINRRTPREWWGPFVAFYRRRALEQKQSGGEKGGRVTDDPWESDYKGIIDNEGKKHEFKIEFFEDVTDEEDEKKKIAGKKVKKAVVDTRGQKIDQKDDGEGNMVGYADRKDYGKDYPEKFPFKDSKQMAEYLMNILKPGGHFAMNSPDIPKFQQLDYAGKLKFLEDRIKQDRGGLVTPEGHTIETKEWDGLKEVVLAQVEEELKLYGKENRSELPSMDKIHVVGLYEYQAQAELAGKQSLGVCFTNAGEIFVNFDLLKQICPDMNELTAQLKRTIAHETIHGSVANNYWALEVEDDGDDTHSEKKEVFLPRRTGLKFMRREVKHGPGMIKERGRALNEAVTENLAKDVTDKIYGKEQAPRPKYSEEPYQPERDLLRLMQEKFNIPFETFAQAVVNRKKLGELARLLDGKSKEGKTERPQFTALIMSVMDYDHNRHSYDYTKAKQLIQGVKGISISREMKLSFPSSLLDKNGDLKQNLVDLYGLVDEEAEARKQRPRTA